MIGHVPTDSWVMLLGAALIWYSTVDYARHVAAGRNRPRLIRWSVGTFTAAVALGSTWRAGSTIGLVIGAASCLRCGQVLAAAAVLRLRERRQPWQSPATAVNTDQHTAAAETVLYLVCLVACVLVGATGMATDNPRVTLLLSMAVDGVACLPIIWRGWRREAHPKPFVLGLIGSTIALFCVSQRSLPDYGWPLYQFSINMAMLLPVALRGWSVEGRHSPDVRPSQRNRVAALAGGVGLLAAAYGLVFAVIPSPGPKYVVEAASAALQSSQLAASSVSRPVPAAILPAVSATISVPPTPGYIAMAPNGRYALIAHRAARIVSVFDIATQQITAQITVPAPPRFIAFCPTAEDRAAGRAGDRAYISMYDDPTDQPSSGQNRHLIGVLDTATQKMIATIPVSARPFAPACSPDGTQLWVPSHDEARVDVIDTATRQLLRSVSVPPNPHWVVFSADGRKVYTACHESNLVSVIDSTTFAVVRIIPVGESPHSEALSPDGRSLAVVNYSSSQLSIIDTGRDIETKRLATGEDPQDVAWSADGKLIYTVNVDGMMNGRPVGTISIINAATGNQTGLVTHDPAVDSTPTSLARSADGATGYITNLHSATLTVLDLTAR